MNFKIHFLIVSLLAALSCPIAASAQLITADKSDYPETGPGSLACQVAREAIINLTPPYFGTPTVWDALFGDHQGLVQFSGAVALENRNVLIVGEKLDMQYNPTEQVLVEMNNRARAVVEKRYPAKPGERSSGVLKSGAGYVVSSTILGGKQNAEKWTRLAWYDAGYNFVREFIVKDSTYNLESMNISAAANGKGFIAVIKAMNRKAEGEDHTMLVRFSADGKIIWKRSFSPGISNHLYNLAVADDTHYIATGQIRHEDGRMAGWLLKLNDDGTIAWQNTYPRGQFAMLRGAYKKSMKFGEDRYVVAGQVIPYGTDPGAAWVLEVDLNGATVWQRYFRATGLDLDGRAVETYPDGRVTVLVNAKARDKESDIKNHIRLLTLSPRGILLDDQGYMEGHAAEARQLISGWAGERIVTAFIEIKKMQGDEKPELITDALVRQEKEKAMAEATAKAGYGPPAPSEEQAALLAIAAEKEVRHEGWVFVATRVGAYTDPCILPPSDPAP